jgi:hypothetical protein
MDQPLAQPGVVRFSPTDTVKRFPFLSLSARMDGVPTDGDWRRLATYVTRRREALGKTQAAVAADGGPSVATLRQIEDGERANYRGGILVRLEQALLWKPGSIDTILAGGEPQVADASGADQGRLADRALPGDDAERIILESDMPPVEKVRWIARLRAAREAAERERAEQAREVIRTWREARGA